MTDTTGFLALLQVSDSLFPSGAFTHSLGLEQLAREKAIRTPDDVERFVISVIESSVATSDAVACVHAVGHAESTDIEALVALDHELFAMKAAAELRAASVALGARLLEEVYAHHVTTTVGALLLAVRAERSPGTHAVAFGVVAEGLAIDARTAASVLMQGTATAMLHASMRLLPVSHRDVQGALHRLRPRIVALAAAAAEPERSLESFHPMQDIAGMRHEVATVRMFAS